MFFKLFFKLFLIPNSRCVMNICKRREKKNRHPVRFSTKDYQEIF